MVAVLWAFSTSSAASNTIPRNYPDWVAHLLHDPTRVEIGGCGGNTAQSTRQRDAIRFGSAIKRFQASTPASIIAARSVKIRFDRKWLRKNRHMRSTGFSSGLYGGKYIMTMLSGTTKPLLLCQPAQSTIRTGNCPPTPSGGGASGAQWAEIPP